MKKPGWMMAGIFCMGVALQAAEPVAMPVDQWVELALEQNPRLQAAREEWGAMQERPAMERSLPNPMFAFGGMDTADRFPGVEERRYRLEQTLPAWGKRGLRGQVAEKEAEVRRFDYEDLRREIALQVKEAFYELAAVRKSLEIVRDEETVLRQMAEIAEAKYAAAEVSQQDVVMAQSELSMRQVRLLELESQEVEWASRLNSLLNRPVEAPVELAVPEPPAPPAGSLETWLASTESSRPDIAAAQARREGAGFSRDLMRKDYLPDVTAGVEYRELAEEDDVAMFMVGVELPVWFRRNAAGVREAARKIAAAQASVEAARSVAAFEIREAWFKQRNARQAVQLYREDLLPQAETRFQTGEAGYRAGQVSFLDLLESERFLLNARLMLSMAERELGIQMARLERAAGLAPQSDSEMITGSRRNEK